MSFLQIRWNVKGINKILVIKRSLIMPQLSLYFNTKMPGKQVATNIKQLIYFNYHKGKSAKEIADMFSWKRKTTMLKRIYRLKKVTQRVERKITEKTVCDSPQSNTGGLALQVKKYSGLRVSHETIRNIFECSECNHLFYIF